MVTLTVDPGDNEIKEWYINNALMEDLAGVNETTVTVAVSYTHLDVYKRQVRFINPQSMEVTDLILHPLTVMDYTLHDEKYMHLDYAEACLLYTSRCV